MFICTHGMICVCFFFDLGYVGLGVLGSWDCKVCKLIMSGGWSVDGPDRHVGTWVGGDVAWTWTWTWNQPSLELKENREKGKKKISFLALRT